MCKYGFVITIEADEEDEWCLAVFVKPSEI
jgi:hypothetical protein